MNAEEIAKALWDSIKSQTGDFLEKHADAKALLQERTARAAKLAALYAVAATPQGRAACLEQLQVVNQTLKNQLSSIALDAQGEARDAFSMITKTAFDVLIRVLPALV